MEKRKQKIFSFILKEEWSLKMLSVEVEVKILMMKKGRRKSKGELIKIFWHGQKLVNNLPTNLLNLKYPTVILAFMEQPSAQMSYSNQLVPALLTLLNLISLFSVSRTLK